MSSRVGAGWQRDGHRHGSRIGEAPTGQQTFALRVLAGPAAFAAVRAAPLAGLGPEAHFAVAAYAWMLAWWATVPVPWAVTSFLPFVLLPVGRVLPFAEVAALYGQTILPFLMGSMLFGHALRKHGLGTRLALALLSMPGAVRSSGSLILAILIAAAVTSALVSDLVVIVIMTPIALSVTRSAAAAIDAGESTARGPRLAAAASLAVLYGSAAGELATPMGVPYNALVLSVLEVTTRYRVSFAQWMSTGTVLAAAHVPIYYLILKLMVAPEARTISASRSRIREQFEQLGPLGRGEKNVLFVLAVMLALWLLPTVATVEFLDIWYVPPVGMVLLFLLPVDGKRGERTLGRKDLQEGVSWNVLFLVVGGMALVSGLTRLGVTDWIGATFTGNVAATALPWLAGLLTTVLTQLTSGVSATVMVSSMLFPIAETLEYNPAILARIVTGTGHSVALPWSSPTAATTFAAGAVHLGTMFSAGVVATVLTSIAVIVLNMVLVPAFHAFTVQ